MHSFRKLTLLITSSVLLSFPLTGLSAPEASDRTGRAEIEQAWVEQALESNASLGAKLAAAKAAAERITGSGSWQDPNLNLMVAPETLGGDDDTGTRIELSQALPWPGLLDARRRMAEARADVSSSQYQWFRNLLVADVEAAYAEWWFINEAIRLHHENQAYVEQLLANASDGYAYGNVRQTDLLQLRRELTDLDMQQYELVEQRRALAARIANLLGERPAAQEVALESDSLESFPDLETTVGVALTGHPLLSASEARIQASRADVKIRQLEKYPKVKLIAGYNSLWVDRSKRAVVGIGLEVPFSGRRQQGALNAAEAELEAQRWEALEQARDVEAEVIQAWENVSALGSRLNVLESEGVPLAEKHWQASLEQVANQQSDYEDAIESARMLTRTHLQQARLKADIHRAIADLESWISF